MPRRDLVGTPSDEVPDILVTGRTDITVLQFSMSARHPEGRDANYIEWHALDHQPEMHRLSSVRASLRLASTPACRAARAAGEGLYDAVDHVMTYFFVDAAALEDFDALNAAMADAGRTPYLRGERISDALLAMPFLDRGLFSLKGMVTAPSIKVGADVLPWWPALGVYLLLERGEVPPSDLIEVRGVGGVLWATGIRAAPPYATSDHTGLQISYCFLDDDPSETGERLRPALKKRWTDADVQPLFAAPFHTIVRYDWARHVP
ncbi:MAG: hypothetical protein ACLQRH_01765 [Acidimicrobiales bacterium]